MFYCTCEWCGEDICENNCFSRNIAEETICVCDWCIDLYIARKLLVKEKDEKDKICYRWTASGVEWEIDNVEESIRKLITRLSKLLKEKREISK